MRSRFVLVLFFALLTLPFFAPHATPQSQTALIVSTTSTTTQDVATSTGVKGHLQQQPAEGALSQGRLFPVVRVLDGDTVVIRYHEKEEKIRLIGIDTPEVVDPRKPVECFGEAASQEMHRLVDGQSVRIELDPSQSEYDKYGRLLAYLFLADGTSVNLHMVAAGFAHEYTYRMPYKYQAQFKAAEAAARAAGRGLWASDACAAQSSRA